MMNSYHPLKFYVAELGRGYLGPSQLVTTGLRSLLDSFGVAGE